VADATTGQQKSIFITGAASGIGRATARLFAERGWFVGCFDVNELGLAGLESELGSVSAMFATLDVTGRGAVDSALENFGAKTGGRLDLLFSNAGIDAKGAFETISWEQSMAVVNVNLIGGMSVIRAGIPLLKATDNSLCLSTSSDSAIFGTASVAVYSATKHAIKGLTEALSAELAPHGVRAADLIPGIIDTGMLSADEKASLPKEGTWRPLSAEEVSEVVWSAYQGDKLHWYIPEELAAYDVHVTTSPEAARDDRIAGRM